MKKSNLRILCKTALLNTCVQSLKKKKKRDAERKGCTFLQRGLLNEASPPLPVRENANQKEKPERLVRMGAGEQLRLKQGVMSLWKGKQTFSGFQGSGWRNGETFRVRSSLRGLHKAAQ